MKKIAIIMLLIITMIGHARAQDTTNVVQSTNKQKTPFSERIYYGGNIGLSFGPYTMVGIYPMIGYKIIPNLSVGIKVAYEYIRDGRYNTDYTTSNYGGSIFTRYRILRPIYLHAEYAMINYKLYNELGESNREWVPFLLVGAGFSQHLGGNAWLNIQVLFDVLQNNKSPYRNWEPFYSVGIGVGF